MKLMCNKKLLNQIEKCSYFGFLLEVGLLVDTFVLPTGAVEEDIGREFPRRPLALAVFGR